MGKKTQYHPVSLHVLRGAPEYCGFRLGKLRHKWSRPEQGDACYFAEIDEVPLQLQKAHWSVLKERFQECFPQNVKVESLWVTPKGVVTAKLIVTASSQIKLLSEMDAQLEHGL